MQIWVRAQDLEGNARAPTQSVFGQQTRSPFALSTSSKRHLILKSDFELMGQQQTHQSRLEQLYPDVLGNICGNLELESVVSLFKIGNLLFTTKLRSGIRLYQDDSESGPSRCNHFWLLSQLQGINSISISDSVLPPSTNVNRNLLEVLPKTVTSLRISGSQGYETCFGKDQTGATFDFASRFPQLSSFTLKDHTENRLLSAAQSDQYFQSFPLTLSQLSLDLTHLMDISVNEVKFPVNLQSLDIRVKTFELGWVLSLCCSHLHTLKVHSQDIYGCEPVPTEKKNLTMKILHLWFDWPYRSLRGVKEAPAELNQLLSVLPELEEFQTHYSEGKREGTSMFTEHLPQLKMLVCGYSRRSSYGNSLVKLELQRDIIDQERDEFGPDSIAQLASLREFCDPLLKMPSTQFSLLPKTLTSLTVWSVDPEAIPLLPPRLFRISTIQSKIEDYDYDSEKFYLLLNSRPSLRIVEVDNGAVIVILMKANVKESIHRSGWVIWKTEPVGEERARWRI